MQHGALAAVSLLGCLLSRCRCGMSMFLGGTNDLLYAWQLISIPSHIISNLHSFLAGSIFLSRLSSMMSAEKSSALKSIAEQSVEPDTPDMAARSERQQAVLASVPGLGSSRDAAADQPAAAAPAPLAAADPPQSQGASQAQSLQAPAEVGAEASSSGPVVVDLLGRSTANSLGQQRELAAAPETASQSQPSPAAADLGGAEGSRAEQQPALAGLSQAAAAAADAGGAEGSQVEQHPAPADVSHAASVASSRPGEGMELAQAGQAAHSAAEPEAKHHQAVSGPSSAAAAEQAPATAVTATAVNEAGTLSGPSAGESGVNGSTDLDGSASGMLQPSTSTAAGQAPQQAAPGSGGSAATQEAVMQAAAPGQQQQQSTSPRGRQGRALQEAVMQAAAPAQPLQQQQLPAPRGREGRVTQEAAVLAPAPAQALQQPQLPTPRRTADVGSAAPRRTFSEVRASFCAPFRGTCLTYMPQWAASVSQMQAS